MATSFEIPASELKDTLSRLSQTVGNEQQYNNDCLYMEQQVSGSVKFATTNVSEYTVIENVITNGNMSGNTFIYPLVNFKRFKSIIDTFDDNVDVEISDKGNNSLNINPLAAGSPISLNAKFDNFLSVPIPSNAVPEEIDVDNSTLCSIATGAGTIVHSKESTIDACVSIQTDKSGIKAVAFDKDNGRVYYYQNPYNAFNNANVVIEVDKLSRVMKTFKNDAVINIKVYNNVTLFEGSRNITNNNSNYIVSSQYYSMQLNNTFPTALTSLFGNLSQVEWAEIESDKMKDSLSRAIAIEDSQIATESINISVNKDDFVISKNSQFGDLKDVIKSSTIVNNNLNCNFKPKALLDIVKSFGTPHLSFGKGIGIGTSATKSDHYIITDDPSNSCSYYAIVNYQPSNTP